MRSEMRHAVLPSMKMLPWDSEVLKRLPPLRMTLPPALKAPTMHLPSATAGVTTVLRPHGVTSTVSTPVPP